MSLIIIEGPDGAGKSTLLEKLSKDTGLKIYRSGGPKDKDTMIKVLEEMKTLALSEETYLTDRAPWFSEVIYSAGMDRDLVLPLDIFLSCYSFTEKVIYCRLSTEEAMLNNMSREFKAHKPAEHTNAVVEHYHRICTLYDQLMDEAERQEINIYEYDWQNGDYQNLLEWIEE